MKHKENQKSIIALLVLLLVTNIVLGQEKEVVRVEKSIWGIHVGIDPISIHNELRLANQIALHSELGLGLEYSGGDWTGSYRLGLEPRYYYNLAKRVRQGRNTAGNSANFFCLNMSGIRVAPIGSSYTEKEGVEVLVVPCWGIRRNVGKHFNLEARAGIGYTYEDITYNNMRDWLGHTYSSKSQEHKLAYLISFGIGYKFNFIK